VASIAKLFISENYDEIKIGDDKTTPVGKYLSRPEEIVDYPTFPEGTKSLLSMHLKR
jgi:hypothetical protein